MPDGFTVRGYGYVAFDIETGPWEGAPPFDEGSVKVGNLKDQEKIEAKIEQEREKYNRSAALDPLTGQIVALTVHNDDGPIVYIEGEQAILDLFSDIHREVAGASGKLFGFNIFDFDLPFIIRRMLVNGKKFPINMMTGNYRYFSDDFIDLRRVWGAGEYQPRGKLSEIFQVLGIAGKTEKSGGGFDRLLKDDRDRAINYCVSEISGIWELGKAMGVTE